MPIYFKPQPRVPYDFQSSDTAKPIILNAISGTGIYYIKPGDDIATAISLAVAGGYDMIRFLPGDHNSDTDEVITYPPNMFLDMRGAMLHLHGAASQFYIPDVGNNTSFFIRVSGSDESLNPLKIGTGMVGSGGLALFENIYVTQVGAGGTCCRIDHLQNSVINNYRHRNVDLATNGLIIDNGTKNLFIFGCFPSKAANGPNVVITTSSGSQRTSKIGIYGGLSENGPTGQGWRFEDCEDVSIHDMALNLTGGTNTVPAFLLQAGGNRDGTGPKGPSSIKIDNPQTKGFGIALQIETAATVHYTEGTGFVDTLYQVNNVNARIFEQALWTTFWTTRFATTVGAVESTVVKAVQYA